MGKRTKHPPPPKPTAKGRPSKLRRTGGQGQRQFLAASAYRQTLGTRSRRRQPTVEELDPVVQGLEDVQRIFHRSAVTPVQSGHAPPTGAKFAIYFNPDELATLGRTIVEINKNHWPLGDPLSSAQEHQYVHPLQKRLYRQRQALLWTFRDDQTGSGNLLSSDADEVRKYKIWDMGFGGVCYFEWVNSFPTGMSPSTH